METIVIQTKQKSQLVDISRHVQELVSGSGISDGAVMLFVPHTTAGITLNENADPAVRGDMLADLERHFPDDQPYYQHAERNSAAHMKTSLMGSSVTVIVQRGQLVLGTWQGIYLCEFDGPRTRMVHLSVEMGRGA